MDLEIKRAFNAPFSEEKWYLKLIFPTIMAAIGMLYNPKLHIPPLYLAIVFIFSILPSLVLSGFFIQFQHNIIHNESPVLPVLKSNVLNYLKYGFKSLSYVLFYFLLIVLSAISLAVATKLPGGFKILLVITSVLAIIFLFLVLIIATSIFADRFCVKDAFNFNRIMSLMSKVRLEFLMFFLMLFVVSLMSTVIISTLTIIAIGTIFVPFVHALVQFIIGHLSAQVYKIAKYKLENTEQ